MTPVARSLLAAIVALSCATHSDRVEAETPTVPPGWTVISPPVTEEGWLCANWARQQWSVEVAESGAVRIDQATGRGGPITLQMQGGRLIGTNRGEFGGALEWEPAGSSRRELILRGNPVAFVASPAGLFLAEGLAHLTISRGRLFKLGQTGGQWTAVQVVDLGEAPDAVRLVGPTTLLVLTTSGVTQVDLAKQAATILFTNQQWRGYMHGNSIVRTSSGAILIGMVRAVVVLAPSSSGFTEAWWVPSSCTLLRKTSETGKCECVAS